jgi:hypothetical protein
MNSDNNTPKLLGAAFLLQAIASLVGYSLLENLVSPTGIIDSMNNITNHGFQVRASIVFQLITAIGIVMLGAMLFIVLRKQNQNIALAALGLYILEAGLLAVSRIPIFSLMQISQESVAAGHPLDLQILGKLFMEAAEFGETLHMVVFGLGATLFYFLLYKSGYIPRAFALFGLVAAPLAFIASLLILFNIHVPLIVMLPNLPFEVGMGLWMLFIGIKHPDFA